MNHKNTDFLYKGLSAAEVEYNRLKYGENILIEPEKVPWWKLFLEKFTDPIIVILLVAMVLSFAVGCYNYFVEGESSSVFFEPLGVLMAVLLATGIAFYFEMKSRKEFEVLNEADDEVNYRIIRDGKIQSVEKKEIVVGDYVILETGEEIPADGELQEAVSLMVDESSLTGEPVVSKFVKGTIHKEEEAYPYYRIYKGTMVVDGHCIYRVTEVGMSTEYGKVYEGAQIDNSVQTPLNRQLDGLAALITKISYVIAVLVIVGSAILYWIDGGFAHGSVGSAVAFFLNKIMIAVTVVVVAVPEGLPMSVSLSLAYSMRRMMKTNNLVRKMHACETMGAATVICSDKTGTLTQNKMKVVEAAVLPQFVQKEINWEELLAEGISVNSTAYLESVEKGEPKVLGNPTEGALLLWLDKKGKDYLNIREIVRQENQLTFSTERKYMATIAYSEVLKQRVLYVKGAPEVVMRMADMTEDEKLFMEKTLALYQQRALRTLCLAYLPLNNEKPIEKRGLSGVRLQLMGVVGIEDPVRLDVRQSIADCKEAGIDIRIITGDTAGTVREIARQLDLWSDKYGDENIISGRDFEALTDEEAKKRLDKIRIMCRARPMDKERFVRLLQEQGEIVAVTGDGTNDAPALKRAHVGLSMGDGTSVAKGASDITILDNSFASIANAVMWGRSLYLNIQRFILFQMTINVAACLIVLIGAFTGVDSPLTVTQMLWVNLIMDTFAALALASLPPSRRVMMQPPRKPDAKIISREMARRIIGVGGLFVFFLFGVLQSLKHSHIVNFSNLTVRGFFENYFNMSNEGFHLSAKELSIFFTLFVFLQFWNMFNAKAFQSGHSTFHKLWRCRNFLLIAATVAVGQFLITTFGGEIFSVTPLCATDWLWLLVVSSLVLWIGEAVRLVRKRR